MSEIYRYLSFLTLLPTLLAAVLLSLSCAQANASTKQYGLVVGIDNYRFGTDDINPSQYEFNNLKGARNDAVRIAGALKKSGVVLPDKHILIDSRATLGAFKDAWQTIMDESNPGDVIILTFAGHGGQEHETSPPIDEGTDRLDETLWFWEFDKRNPSRGRLVDDELFKMFERASDRQIVFVADSCHSGGLTRSLDRRAGIARTDPGFILQLGSDGIGERPLKEVTEPEESWQSLQHVTYLTATSNEANVVIEVPVDDRPHGALSVSFAEALEGRADTNDDGIVSRRELAGYIDIRVKALANDKQDPGFMPRGASTDSDTVFSLVQAAVNSRPKSRPALRVAFNNMDAPNAIRNAHVSDLASLVFELKGEQIIAYFDTDEIYRWSLPADKAETTFNVQRLVDKYRLIEAVDEGFNVRQLPLTLSLTCEGMEVRGHCNNEHRLNESISLQIDLRTSESLQTANGTYFVLFNLAGSGELQNQYPFYPKDKPSLKKFPHTLNFKVGTPVGRDDFVALFCKSDPVDMKTVIENHHKMSAPDPQSFLNAVERHECQMNRLALFTAL